MTEEHPFDYELMPSGYSVGPHRNESTHWLLREIERCCLDDNPLIKEAVCRLQEAEDYFAEREREQDRLHLKIMQLVPYLKDFDDDDQDRYWRREQEILLKNDDPDDALDSVSKYMQELYVFARTLVEEKAGIPEMLAD